MANIKNFGIHGVGNDVQFGKGGNRVVSSNGQFAVVDTANAAVRVSIANAVVATDAVALGQLTDVANALTSNAAAQAALLDALQGNAAAQQTLLDGLAGNATAQQALLDAIQAELDATQAGAGLNADGSYAANATGNYVSGATSLADADNKIDAALKGVADQVAALANTSAGNTDALQAEVDAIEAAVGLNTDGTFSAPTGTNYIDTATSVIDASLKLDAALKAVDTAYKAADATLTDSVANVANSVAAETTRAQTAEQDLSTRITNEVTRATDAEAAIANSVLIETIRAQGAEQTIANSVAAEVARATAAEAEIANSVAAETTRATGVEGGLRTDLDALSSKVTAMGSVFNYAGTLDGSDLDLDNLPTGGKDIGDYYKIVNDGPLTFTWNAGADSIVLNKNDGLVKSATGWDKIDNTDSAVFGTTDFIDVTGSADVGYTVNISGTFADRLKAVESATSVDTADLQDQIDDLRANAAAESARIDGVDAAQNAALAAEANARQAADTLNAQAISDEANARTAADTLISTNLTNLQNEVDAIELATGLNTDGTFKTITGSNYTDAATSVLGAVSLLDAALKAENVAMLANAAAQQTAIDAINTNASTLANTVSSVQAELDRTQVGAGLAANGDYVANATGNYISGATSLSDADNKLDAAIKAVSTGLANLSQDEIVAQNKLYSVKAANTAVEFYGDVNGTKTLFGNAVTGAAQDSTLTLSTAVAGEVRFEAHSGTASNVDIRLVPQGTGQVVVGETGTDGVIQADDGFDLTLAGGDNAAGAPGNLVLRGGVGSSANGTVYFGGTDTDVSALAFTKTATGLTLAAVGSAANLDVILTPKGTGVIDASNAKIVHVADGVDPKDAVNKSQLDAVAAAASSATSTAQVGSVRTTVATLTAANGAVNLATLVKGTVLRVKVLVTQAYANGTTISVGSAAGTSELAASSDVDEALVGMYLAEAMVDYSVATQVIATVAGSNGTNGAAKVIVEYLQG